jgi:SRSO17 transposase
MLPEIRYADDPYSIPKFDMTVDDFDNIADELKEFHEQFYDCFNRTEPRENFYNYMVGQLSPLERKSIEPIALSVENGKVRAMQHFISGVRWDEDKMMLTYHSMIKGDMGDSDGVLIFDESGIMKKGKESAGVARQYCGNTGKVDNCQVGVYVGYATRYGYCLLGCRLFIPEIWFTDEYAERRKRCCFPPDLKFKTKPELAAELFKEIVSSDQIPFRYVAADSVYGNSPVFREAVESVTDVVYFVGMPNTTQFWLKRPSTEKKEYNYRGEQRSKIILKTPDQKPQTFDSFAKGLNDFYWYRRKVSEGTKGPIEYEFTKRQIVLSHDGLPGEHVWLIIRRTVGDDPIYSYYISNAMVSTRLKLFVWLSGIRWAIEQSFEEAKSELGMDHYEVRKWPGWYHHMMTCMLALYFLWHLKIRLGKKNASYYCISDPAFA